VAHFDDQTNQVRWNAPTANMKKWLRDANRRTGGTLCRADAPELADVVIVWQDLSVRTPYLGYGYGTTIGSILDGVNLAAGRALFPQDPFASTSLGGLTGWSTPAARSESGVFVTAFATRSSPPLSIVVPAAVTWRIGRWPWSKPDTDALAHAIDVAVSRTAGTR
jgi:hypothetical protein